MRWQALGHVVAYTWPLLILPLLRITEPKLSGARVGFFALTLLWPITWLVARVWGMRAGLAASGLCVGLFVLRAVSPAYPLVAQPIGLERRFESPSQMVRHRMRIPVDDRTWSSVLALPDQTRAFLYLLVAQDSAVAEPSLTVRVNGGLLGELTAETVISTAGTWENERHVWHRLPLSLQDVAHQPALEVTLAPRAGESFVPGAVGLVGGFNYRPTDGVRASGFFDGQRWAEEPCALLPLPSPGSVGPINYSQALRYYIELRLVRSDTGRLIAVQY